MAEGNDISGQQAAQPVPASQGAQPQGNPLSTELIQQLVAQAVESTLSTYEKRQQSQRDKLEKRINDRVVGLESIFKSLNGGQELSAEQRGQLRNMAAEEVQKEPAEHDAAPSPQAAAQPQANVETSPLEKMVLKQMQKAGMTIEDGDPELELLKNIDATDLDELTATITKAVEQKKARLQNKPSTLTPDTANARVSAATVSGTPGNSIANINDPTTLLAMGLTKKR